jgi:hypothetical protein
MRWRGSSAEHLCWRRSAVRWPWGSTGPFRRVPATTPSPSEPGPPLHLRPLGSYSSGARGTAAVGAGAMEPSVNELIDTTFGCYPSSKSADAMPKGAPSAGTHAQHATLLMHFKCCNFRPTGPFGITLRAGWVMDGATPHCHWPCHEQYTAPAAGVYIPCNPGMHISLGSQGVKLCPPTGCAGVLYHLQGVFEPVYNRFIVPLLHVLTTSCSRTADIRPRSLFVASAS